MKFAPAIAAQHSFHQSQTLGELGEESDRVPHLHHLATRNRRNHPSSFRRGLERCEQYLERCVPNQKYNQNALQTRELRTSFLNALGLSESVIHPLLPNYGPNPNICFAGQQSHTDD